MHSCNNVDVLVSQVSNADCSPHHHSPLAVRLAFETNVLSVLTMVQEVGPVMAKAKQGLIVNVGRYVCNM